MKSVLINSENNSDISLLLSLAKKLGMDARTLTKAEVANWQLAQKIEKGMKSPNVSRSEVMKALET